MSVLPSVSERSGISARPNEDLLAGLADRRTVLVDQFLVALHLLLRLALELLFHRHRRVVAAQVVGTKFLERQRGLLRPDGLLLRLSARDTDLGLAAIGLAFGAHLIQHPEEPPR